MEMEAYRRRVAALREENECLRQAAHAFGELAERLAHELREVRAQMGRVDHRQSRGIPAPGTTITPAMRSREVVRQR